LQLKKNIDILNELSKIKRNNQIFIGFAAESNDLKENALAKLKDKKLDMLVANDISRTDVGFDSDYNEVSVFYSDGRTEFLDRRSKVDLAKNIVEIAGGLADNA
jgi:phosphopantothenoylcysteine decarboxylase/phosphopantothenate--cysteine ligase